MVYPMRFNFPFELLNQVEENGPANPFGKVVAIEAIALNRTQAYVEIRALPGSRVKAA